MFWAFIFKLKMYNNFLLGERNYKKPTKELFQEYSIVFLQKVATFFFFLVYSQSSQHGQLQNIHSIKDEQ